MWWGRENIVVKGGVENDGRERLRRQRFDMLWCCFCIGQPHEMVEELEKWLQFPSLTLIKVSHFEVKWPLVASTPTTLNVLFIVGNTINLFFTFSVYYFYLKNVFSGKFQEYRWKNEFIKEVYLNLIKRKGSGYFRREAWWGVDKKRWDRDGGDD